MSENISSLITGNAFGSKIIFAAVNEEVNSPVFANGVWLFPDELSLREFRLQNKSTIWLDECIDKKCRHCNGTGKLGVKITPLNKTKAQIVEFLLLAFDPVPTTESLVSGLIEWLSLPINFQNPLRMLTDNMLQQLNKDDKELVAKLFANILREDFVKKEQVFCNKCFAPNLNKKLQEVRRNIKFLIN
jgi:hypothetical protein